MKKLVYSDSAYETQVKDELQKAQTALQKLLNCWDSLGLVPCTNLFQLAFSPQKVHSDAVHETAEVPIAQGKFMIRKDVFINLLDVPVPDELYRAAREARSETQVGRPALWSIEGNKVILNQEKADELIHAKNVYAETPAQVEFAEAVLKYLESGNYIHKTLTASPGFGYHYNLPFSLIEKGFQFVWLLQLEPDQFREILKVL